MILRAKKLSENHKAAISRATISCSNHIPAYPHPANHVAIKSPPRNSPLTSCLARCEGFDLSIDFEGSFTSGSVLVFSSTICEIMNEKPVEEMDVCEVLHFIEKQFNTEVAEKFEGTFNKCQTRFVDVFFIIS